MSINITKLLLEANETSSDYATILATTATACGAMNTPDFPDMNPHYEEGVFAATFVHQKDLEMFREQLTQLDFVEDEFDVAMSLVRNGTTVVTATDDSEEETDYTSILSKSSNDVTTKYNPLTDRIYYTAIVYVKPEFVTYSDSIGYVDLGDDELVFDDEEPIEEVVRKVKVNSRGQRTIKMKCGAGFKWDSVNNVCVKIAGQELANKRIAIKKAIISKRAQGNALKIRVNRKTKKAMRYRKSMGL